MSEPDFKFKICLLGDPNVGKTSCVYRFIENKFSEDYKTTLGVNLLKKDVDIEGLRVSIQIWDLGGQDSFKSLRKLYLEGSKGALVLFDVTNKESFENLNSWIADYKTHANNEFLCLIGNKIDLKDQMQVSDQEGSDFAKENNMDFLLTSAKTGENVEAAFIDLIKSILKDAKS